MIEFVLAPQNLPFAVSLVLMLFMALLEGVGSVLGLGVSEFFDTLLPELDIDVDIDADIDVDAPDIGAPSGFTKLLGWLRVGQVPALILMILFLTSFGLSGLCIQSMVKNIVGTMMPATLATIPALIFTIPLVRVFGGLLAKILPKDETDAVSEDSFIGRTASIVLGKAQQGSPAQAKLRDHHGTTHYIMVEPDINGEIFEAGMSLLIVRRNGSIFRAILNTNPALQD